MKKYSLENWYKGEYALLIPQRYGSKYKAWIKKQKGGSWSLYHLNEHARKGKLWKSGFARRKDAINYVLKR